MLINAPSAFPIVACSSEIMQASYQNAWVCQHLNHIYAVIYILIRTKQKSIYFLSTPPKSPKNRTFKTFQFIFRQNLWILRLNAQIPQKIDFGYSGIPR